MSDAAPDEAAEHWGGVMDVGAQHMRSIMMARPAADVHDERHVDAVRAGRG